MRHEYLVEKQARTVRPLGKILFMKKKNDNPHLQAAVILVVKEYGVRVVATALNNIGIPFEQAYQLIFGREPRV